jgi:hypothetical protein
VTLKLPMQHQPKEFRMTVQDEDNIVNQSFNWQCTKNYCGAEKCFVVNVDLEMVLKVLEIL